MQGYAGLFDALVLCKFLIHSGVHPSLIAEGLASITGFDYDLNKLMEAGERIFNLKRAYNYRCGVGTRDHDKLPKIVQIPLKEGGAKGYVPNIEPLLDEYYKLRGWNEKGIPTHEKLKELGLEDIAEDIWKRCSEDEDKN